MTVDSRSFRNTIGLFATGISVVASEIDGQIHAMTANAVSSLSLNPTLMLFCPSKKASLSRFVNDMPGFSVNFLREDQQALSSYFAGVWQEALPPPFRFVPAQCAPRLEGALASVNCTMHQVVDGGDHWLVIGQVMDLHQGIEPHRPLLFFKGTYRAVDFSISTPAPDLAEVTHEPAHVFYDSWQA